MSAWLCSAKHLSIVVNAVERFDSYGEGVRLRAEHAQAARTKDGVIAVLCSDAETLFADLLEENVKSLQARYPDDAGVPHDDCIWGGADAMAYDPCALPLSVADAMKLIHSYRYQACEHDGWKGSNAERFTESLLLHLTHHVPGYDDDKKARWSVD